jgi:hypothetical protein
LGFLHSFAPGFDFWFHLHRICRHDLRDADWRPDYVDVDEVAQTSDVAIVSQTIRKDANQCVFFVYQWQLNS